MRRVVIISVVGLFILAAVIAVWAKDDTAVATLLVSEGQATITQSHTRLGILTTTADVTFHAGDVVTIGQGDVIVQESGAGQLRLQDGSAIDLTAGTTLVMAELVITASDFRVQIQLLAGQTANRVEKLLGTSDYFRVQTPSSTAAVRGTLFSVEVVSETATLVKVDEGVVRVTLGVDMVDVGAGEMVTAVVGQPLHVQPQLPPPAPTGSMPTEPAISTPPDTATAAAPVSPSPTTQTATVTSSAATSTLSATATNNNAVTPTLPGDTIAPPPTATLPATVPATVTAVPPTTTPLAATDTPVVLPTATLAPPTATFPPTATATLPPPPTETPTSEPLPPTPELVTLCHVPAGNPNNAQTIQVPPEDVAGHLAHGDYLGPCQ